LRGRGDAILWQRLAHERSGLAAALLLGIREELSAEATQAYSKTGTIHLLSISGLHVGILAGFLFWAMRLRLAGRGAGLAMAALVWFGPRTLVRPSADPLDRLIARTRPWHVRTARVLWRSAGQMTLLTACVWAVSAPLVMAQFHLFSPATLVLTPLLAVP